MNTSRLRTRPVLLLTVAALLTSLVLGGTLIALLRITAPREEAVRPLTDEQARQQVLGPAREFVEAGRLRAAAGTYVLLSCQPGDEPPYQGVAYLSFDVPTVTETPAYFGEIAAAMRARGWAEGLPPNEHLGGRLLSKDGVRATYYRSPEVPGRGVLEINGECRNVTDHRQDVTGFVDVTAEINR